MSTQTIERTADALEHAGAEPETDDPFQLDITFIENTPDTETVLMCRTGDTCVNGHVVSRPPSAARRCRGVQRCRRDVEHVSFGRAVAP